MDDSVERHIRATVRDQADRGSLASTYGPTERVISDATYHEVQRDINRATHSVILGTLDAITMDYYIYSLAWE